jgi:hypothetical protein
MHEARIKELEQKIAGLERQVSVLTVKISNILAERYREPAFGKWVVDHQQEYQDFQRRFPSATLNECATSVR